MIKKIVIAGVVVLVILLLYLFGAFSFIDDYLNKNPDRSCQVDSDCAWRSTHCGCGCGGLPLNKEWKRSCFFSYSTVSCKACGDPPEVKCENNLCVLGVPE